MFVLGGLAEENMVPIGASFDNGMRNDCHDAVSAELIIPIGVWSSQPAVAAASAHCPPEPKQPAEAARPAAGGAPQPAVAAAAASQPAVAAASAHRPPEPEQPAEAARPAAGEAPQPAVAAAAASHPAVAAASAHRPPEPEQPAEAARPAAGGAPQPAVTAAAAEKPREPERPAASARPAAGGAQGEIVPGTIVVAGGVMLVAADESEGGAAKARPPAGADRPAAGGAPQPAVAASAAENAHEGGAARPPTPSAEAEPKPQTPSSPDWGTDVEGEVADLHAQLRHMEEADDIPEEVQQELGRILFLKRTVETAGHRRHYVASKEETVNAIRKLLKRRKDFMRANGLNDGDSHSVEGRYLFSDRDRQQVMAQWKEEFHELPHQVAQQMRDSFKEDPKKDKWRGKGKTKAKAAPNRNSAGADWGPNKTAVQKGKHSRFARHLQLEAGSKTMAELIIYAGRFDPDFLRRAHEERSGAGQPAGNHEEQQRLKRAAAEAKLEYRNTCLLRRRLDNKQVEFRHLASWEQHNLHMLENGSLLDRTNEAILAYGHGMLRSADGNDTLEIGGSTGGMSRYLLDGYEEPDLATFLAKY